MHCTIVLCPIPAIRLLSLSLESVYERAPYFHSHLRYDFRSRHRSSSHLSGTRLMPGSIVMVSATAVSGCLHVPTLNTYIGGPRPMAIVL